MAFVRVHTPAQPDRFVRVPTDLLEALLHLRLSGLQYRIFLWAIRHTYGWNRSRTRFTWYRMAKDLNSNRGSVFRAGTQLLKAGVLDIADGYLGVSVAITKEQLWRSRTSVAIQQHLPVPSSNENDAGRQRFSGRPKTDVN